MQKPRRFALVALVWIGMVAGLGLGIAEVKAAASPALHLQELQLSVEDHHKSVSWQFSTPPTAVKAFLLSAPARLVIDISGLASQVPSATYTTTDATLWRVRQGAHPRHVRFVLDFKGKTVPDFVVEQNASRITVVLKTPEGSGQEAYTQELFPRRSVTRDRVQPSPVPAVSSPSNADLAADNGLAGLDTDVAGVAQTAQVFLPPSAGTPEASSSAAVLHLQELQLAGEGNQKTLTFHFSRPPTTLRSFALNAPSRLVIDVTGPVTSSPSVMYVATDSLVQHVRSGTHPSRLRFVLDLTSSRIPPFDVTQNGTVVTAVFTLSQPEETQSHVLFRRSIPAALAAHGSPYPISEPAPAPPPVAFSAHAADETSTGTSVREQLDQTSSESQLLAETAPRREPEESLFSKLRDRVDGIAFVKNETAFRLHSPHQFSKVENWLQADVDVELTDWAKLTTIGRVLIDPANHLESNIHDFNAGPIDRWEESDFFEAELRELYLEIVYEDFDFRFGRQQVVWGESLGLRILDVLHPQDFREFILDDFIDARIPLWGSRVDYTFEDWTFEGIWFLDFEENRLADQGSEWQFRNAPLPALPVQTPFPPFPSVQVAKTKKPQDGRLSDSEVGFRVTRFLRNMDVSLNYFYGWGDFPVPFRSTTGLNQFLIEPRHERFHLLGGTFNYAFDIFVIRGEGGLKLGEHFVSTDPREADGVKQREFLSYVLGLDWTVNDNLTANFQFFQNVIFNKPKDIPDEAVNNIVSVFLRADFLNETLFPQFVALYGINFGDFLLRPLVEYQINDFLTVKLGVDVFLGSRSGLFGQFGAPAGRFRDRHFTGQNDRIFLELKRSFAL